MRMWWWIASILVIAAVVVALVEYVDSDLIIAMLHNAQWYWVIWAVVLVAFLILLEAVEFAVMIDKMADISLGETILLYFASQAPTVVPGGIFFKGVMLQREVGTPMSATTPVVLLQSFADYIMLVVAAVAGALYFHSEKGWALGIAIGSVVILILLFNRRVRDFIIGWISGIAESRGMEDKLGNFLDAAYSLLTGRMVSILLVVGIVLFALSIAVLWLVARAFGVSGSFFEMALVFALPTLLGRISALPLGIGVMDVTMVGTLKLLPHIDLNTAIVVVGVYRLVRYLLPVLAGGALYFAVWLPVRTREESGRA